MILILKYKNTKLGYFFFSIQGRRRERGPGRGAKKEKNIKNTQKKTLKSHANIIQKIIKTSSNMFFRLLDPRTKTTQKS